MKVLASSAVYFGTSIINKVIPFLLLPVLTHILTPQEFAILSIFMVFNSFAVAVLGMNIGVNISRSFSKVGVEDIALIVGNAVVITAVTALIALLGMIIISFFADSIFSIPSKYLLLVPVLSILMIINSLNLTVLRNQQRALMFGFFEIITMLISVGLTVAFLFFTRIGWMAQVWGYTLGNLFVAVMSVVYLRRSGYMTIRPEPLRITSMLRISVPMIPHAVSAMVIAFSDRLFIENMVGLEAVALYAIGYSFGSIPAVVIDSFVKAWSPWFYQRLNDPVDVQKKRVVKYIYLYLLTMSLFAVLFGVIAVHALPYVVGDAYDGAQKFVFWVSAGYAAQAAYKIFFPFLVHIGKTSFLAYSTALSATANLVLNYVLIGEFGAIGAAYATGLAFTLNATLVFVYQCRNYDMPWLGTGSGKPHGYN